MCFKQTNVFPRDDFISSGIFRQCSLVMVLVWSSKNTLKQSNENILIVVYIFVGKLKL